MRYIIIISIIIFSSCGGSISEEQRKALREEIDHREIRKISEEEITSKAYEIGEKIAVSNEQQKVSLIKQYKAEVYFLGVDTDIKNKVENRLMEAYKYSFENNTTLGDNVQRDGEFMIYSVPQVDPNALVGIDIIRLPRKQLVLSL